MKNFKLFVPALFIMLFMGCEKEFDPDITARFDPEFAAVLQIKGYIPNTSIIRLSYVNKIRVLNLIDVGIAESRLASLKGIEYFSSLTELYCGGNRLAHLDLSENSALVKLNCAFNELTSLNVTGSRALTYLYCGSNRLIKLDVSENKLLQDLRCNNNDLVKLDIGNNMMLRELDCSDNELTNIDIAKNKALTMFYCFRNLGNGEQFIVNTWFDNNNIPKNFTVGSWTIDDHTVTIDYKKVN